MISEVTRAAVAPSGTTTTLIYDDWYPAIRASEIHGRQMAKAMLLGIPLVLGRKSDGHYFAMRDSCPHRGIPLSYGWFDGQQVTCKYHGWAFEPVSGQCREIPSLTQRDSLDPCKIYATAFPCEERDGHVWVYVPQSGRGRLRTDDLSHLPAVPEVPKFSKRFHAAHLTADLPCNIDHGIIGLMDPAHGPFVHRAWWWRGARSAHEKAKAFAPSDWGFTMCRHPPSRNSRAYKLLGSAQTEIAFRLPSVRIERIDAGRLVLCNLTAITPVDDATTEINHCWYWNARWLGAAKWLARPFVRAFLAQDAAIMARQQKGLRFDPVLSLIDDADMQARWYYRLKREYRAARAENRPFANPVEPRTLRWRS